jgi:hypothetical protein
LTTYRIGVLFLACALTAQAPAVGPSLGASAVVEAIACSVDRGQAPIVSTSSATEFPAMKYERRDASVASDSPDFYRISFSIPEGNYFLKVQTKHCRATVQAGFVAGRSRVVTVALARSIARMFWLENSVAGGMPLRPVAVLLVSPDGKKRNVDVQGNEYYVERVTPGQYIMRVQFHDGLQSDIPVDWSDLTKTGMYQYDISLKSIRDHLGTILKDEATYEKCLWCYP